MTPASEFISFTSETTDIVSGWALNSTHSSASTQWLIIAFCTLDKQVEICLSRLWMIVMPWTCMCNKSSWAKMQNVMSSQMECGPYDA